MSKTTPSAFAEFTLEGEKNFVEDEGSKGGRKGTSLIDTFFHQEDVPFSVGFSEVDFTLCAVEEVEKREKLRVPVIYDVVDFFAGDVVEHVLEVEANEASGGGLVVFLLLRDVLFDGELGCTNHEVHTILNSDSKVEGEEVTGKFRSENECDMVREDATDGGRDTNRSKLRGVVRVFV